MTLKSGSEVTKGHCKCYHSIDLYGFLLVFFSNFVPKTHCCSGVELQKCRDLKNGVRGSSRSLEISPFDRSHMTSYWRYIVTVDLSRVVSEICNVEKYGYLEIEVRGHSNWGQRSLNAPFWDILLVSIQWPWNPGYGSLKVIENDTIRSGPMISY